MVHVGIVGWFKVTKELPGDLVINSATVHESLVVPRIKHEFERRLCVLSQGNSRRSAIPSPPFLDRKQRLLIIIGKHLIAAVIVDQFNHLCNGSRFGLWEIRESFSNFSKKIENFWKIFFKASVGVEVPSSKIRADLIYFLRENVLVILVKMEFKKKKKICVGLRNDPFFSTHIFCPSGFEHQTYKDQYPWYPLKLTEQAL